MGFKLKKLRFHLYAEFAGVVEDIHRSMRRAKKIKNKKNLDEGLSKSKSHFLNHDHLNNKENISKQLSSFREKTPDPELEPVNKIATLNNENLNVEAPLN